MGPTTHPEAYASSYFKFGRKQVEKNILNFEAKQYISTAIFCDKIKINILRQVSQPGQSIFKKKSECTSAK